MRKRLIILFLSIVISSCDFILGTKNLGSGYYLDTDEILYTTKNSYDGIGYNVVPTKVISYNKTEDVIIASSMNNKGIVKYWIILKKNPKNEIKYLPDSEYFVGYYVYSNVIGPLSKKEFENTRGKYRIPEELNLIID